MLARRVLLAVVLALACAAPARANDDEARLRARVPAAAVPDVVAAMRDARAAGLPTGPLLERALEGASRHIDGAAIVVEVRRFATAMAGARQALGPATSDDEIEAGASALLAGVPPDSLSRLRAARVGSIVVPLVVLCDFVARGVPQPEAAGDVLQAARARANDAQLLRLRERVHERIERGRPAGIAAREVVRNWLRQLPDRSPAPPARTRGGP
jgi:hypothetical protein